MMTQTAEYGIGRHEAPGHGSNGQPNKVFKLAPVEDSRTKIILEARRDVLCDADLDYGARCLFALLLDLSLSWTTQRADGVVCISVTKLSELLKCSPRTIYDWNQQLEQKRYVWMTHQRMPNMWPVNTYHITRLDSPDEPHQLATKDGLWGNGARRDFPPVRGDGARQGGGPLHSLHATEGGGAKKTANLRQNACASGSPVHASTAKNAVESRKVCGGEPQSLRRATAKNAVGSRKKGQVATAKNNMRPPQSPSDNKESIDPVNESVETSLSCSTAEVGASSMPDQQFSGSPAIKFRPGEKEFLARLADTLARYNPGQAAKEMANWGGRWRNRFREDPSKAHRVLAELGEMVKVGAISRNAGAAADDLWNRFA